MTIDSPPLKYMGTQSRETVAMEAALALAAERLATDDAPDRLTDRAVGKAKEAVETAAAYVGDRATTAVETYTKQDPLRAVLIAAAAGALLMGIVASMARSGARTVQRKVRRSRL